MNARGVLRVLLGGAALALAACSGSSGPAGVTACSGDCQPAQDFLAEADVQRIVAQAVAEAQARGVRAQVAVVDRVGNVLATFEMTGAPATVAITGGSSAGAGLEVGTGLVPAPLAAIAKAITGAYLSSRGNAFSTRTAGQIIQPHFDPQEAQQPAGPLYGVQFSQLSCSDVNRNLAHGSVGPKRSPLGLAADPGGLPLYKNGVLVGGIGVEANGAYGYDRDITDVDQDVEELVAVAGSAGFAAPEDIRGNRITADGRTFRYVDSESLASDPARAPAFSSLPGALVAVSGYSVAAVRAGTTFGTAASGLRADSAAFAAAGGWILVDSAGANRFAPRDSSDGALRAAEVQTMLAEALAVARRSRGQIRRPLGSFAEVTISVVDANGDILGLVRTPDAPLFGVDVAVQKARTAMFFSHPRAGAELLSLPAAAYLNGSAADVSGYVARVRAFLGDANALTGNIAWSARAIGNLHRPTFPDGIEGTVPGPLSTPLGSWSPFNVGLQLDLVNNQLGKGVLGDVSEGCAGRLPAGAVTVAPDAGLRKIRNGIQIFPGGVPIFRGSQLVGGIGISGDGVDQDDMIAFLGLANASRVAASGFGNAPAAMRADTLTPMGTRLRYAQCPQSPFNDSTEQNVCAGL
ncbi:MAG: heme-binding protein [Usitatibacter sp.]